MCPWNSGITGTFHAMGSEATQGSDACQGSSDRIGRTTFRRSCCAHLYVTHTCHAASNACEAYASHTAADLPASYRTGPVQTFSQANC